MALMGSSRIKDRVVEYLTRHPGTTVWRGDIVKDLDLTESQITSAVNSAMRSNVSTAKDHIVVVESGRAWRWSDVPVARDNGKPRTTRLFEELATLPDGRTLAKGDDGKVYWLSEV